MVEVDGQSLHRNRRFLKPTKVVNGETEFEVKTPEVEVPKTQEPSLVQSECPEWLQEPTPPGNSSQVDATTKKESLRVPDWRTNSTLPSKESAPLSSTTTRYGRIVRKTPLEIHYVQ